MVGTPVCKLVDLIIKEVHRAARSLSLPLGFWHSHLGSNGLPLVWNYSQKEPITPLPLLMPTDSSEVIASLSGSSTLPTSLAKGSPFPCYITPLTLPAGAFKHVNLKAYGKKYACGNDDKASSNQDTMVSHYLQEHLDVCSVCSKHEMSYSDPSNVQCHDRELHMLLFYQFCSF